ncbi:unnamed protein product [Adineta steineri]|uniref:Fas-associated factor 1/2-like UAS domain-containing protein n=1 Tax=Adineta steineri TaxID=433720 RepID=A0A815T279_9BILA|nr:unnamed protein product [Adineta steineri]CAF1497409.1 unnamed protein product [Adineta steineri]
MKYEQSTTSSSTSDFREITDASSFDDTNTNEYSGLYDSDNSIVGSQNHLDNDVSSISEGSQTIKLSSEFFKLYAAYGPHLCYGPLNDDTVHALFHNNSRPLILLLHNDKSVAANIFRNNVLRSEVIVDYLMENFIVWAWDRTYKLNHENVQ